MSKGKVSRWISAPKILIRGTRLEYYTVSTKINESLEHKKFKLKLMTLILEGYWRHALFVSANRNLDYGLTKIFGFFCASKFIYEFRSCLNSCSYNCVETLMDYLDKFIHLKSYGGFIVLLRILKIDMIEMNVCLSWYIKDKYKVGLINNKKKK